MIGNTFKVLPNNVIELIMFGVIMYIASLSNLILAWMVIGSLLLSSGLMNGLLILIFYSGLIVITFIIIIPNGIGSYLGSCLMIVYLVGGSGVNITGFIIMLLLILIITNS